MKSFIVFNTDHDNDKDGSEHEIRKLLPRNHFSLTRTIRNHWKIGVQRGMFSRTLKRFQDAGFLNKKAW